MRNVAIAVAVEHYSDSRIPSVEYAASDATEFARALAQHGFTQVEQLLLVDTAALKSTIESKLHHWISNLSADDVLYMYLVGREFTDQGRHYLACHDTMLDNLSGTSLSLDWLFGQFREATCQKIVLFLDVRETGLPITLNLRSCQAELIGDPLTEIFEEGEHRLCFAACQPGQSSRSHGTLKHGIWACHLIQALNGDAPLALDKANRLTSSSLQRFLKSEVPRSVRNLFTGTQTQTPVVYGTLSHDFLIADLDPLLTARLGASDPSQQQLRSVRLFHEQKLPVKNMSGFCKGNFIPDRINDAAEAFLAKIAEKDVEVEIDQIHEDLKSVFKLKRRDIKATVDGGSGSIVTPYFDYEVTVSLNPDKPSEALFRRQVTSIRQPEMVFCEEFDQVFQGKFDRLEFGTQQTLNIEQIVDQIESLESDEIEVSYNKEVTRCAIHLTGSQVQIEVTPEHFCLTQSARQSPKALIQSFFDAQTLLIETHGLKNLPFQAVTD